MIAATSCTPSTMKLRWRGVLIAVAVGSGLDRIIVTVDTADYGRDRFAGRARADALAIGTAEAPGWLDLGRGAHHRARRPADAHPPWAAGG